MKKWKDITKCSFVGGKYDGKSFPVSNKLDTLHSGLLEVYVRMTKNKFKFISDIPNAEYLRIVLEVLYKRLLD